MSEFEMNQYVARILLNGILIVGFSICAYMGIPPLYNDVKYLLKKLFKK